MFRSESGARGAGCNQIRDRRAGEDAAVTLWHDAPFVGSVRRAGGLDDGIRLDQLSLSGLNRCGAAISRPGTEATSREDVAGRLVRFFYERFTDKDGKPALSTVRCFETRSVNELSDEDRSIVRHVPDPDPQSKCLKLISTAGEGAME